MKNIFIVVIVVNTLVNAISEESLVPLENEQNIELTTYAYEDKGNFDANSVINLPIVPADYNVAIEENPQSTNENIDFETEHSALNEEYEPMKESDYNYNDVINKDPQEIMDTAAGFVPVPIFKKRKSQRPRKQFAHRRYFKRPHNPYRRQGVYYYFYPYYRYYYPGSLRFY